MQLTWLHDCPELAVSPSNLNGWFTDVHVGKATLPRQHLLVKMLRELNIHIATIKEHHIQTEAVLSSGIIWLRSHGYEFLSHLQESDGIGGVGILWKAPKWSVCSSYSFRSLGRRFLVVELADANGFEVRVVSAHFDCLASVKRKQWITLGEELRQLHAIPTVFCADHNSMMVPGRDQARVPKKEADDKVRARAVEAEAISAQGWVDTWEFVHDKEDPPPGWTFDFKARDGGNPR